MSLIMEIAENAFSKRCEELGLVNWLNAYKNHIIPNDVPRDFLYDVNLDIGSIDDSFIKSPFYYDNGEHVHEYLTPFYVRWLAIKYCGFTLVTRKVIDRLVKYMEEYTGKDQRDIKVLEIGAGIGTLTFGLREAGINCTAVDLLYRREPFDDYRNVWVDDIINEEQSDVLRSMIHDIDLVICCWPDTDYKIENIPEIIRNNRPDLPMIYCGEGANDQFFDLIEEWSNIYEVNEVYPSWQGTYDYWNLLTFKHCHS